MVGKRAEPDPSRFSKRHVHAGHALADDALGTVVRKQVIEPGVLENIRPMIETFPLEQASDAYARMMEGKARFRMVLVTSAGAAQKSATK